MKSRQKITPDQLAQELLAGQSRELLAALHLLTPAGELNADARRKLKQVNHLITLLRPALDDVLARYDDPAIVDVGSGKSYLGFLLYDLFLRGRPGGRVISIETRQELVQRARELAGSLGMMRMEFQHTAAQDALLPARTHMLVALHACDTATDDALLLGLRAHADYIAAVPCCQAQVAQQLRDLPGGPLEDLWSEGIHRREFGSHLTNVLRVLALRASGYQVIVTELVGWEHSLKNELILARRVGAAYAPARKRLAQLLAALPVKPKLLVELGMTEGQGR
jgi:protein-L-isoaspartate O-methyltransferase